MIRNRGDAALSTIGGLDREARHPTLTKRPRECHAIPLGSGVSAGVQEVLVCKGFRSCEFASVRFSSEYLLTETLTFVAENRSSVLGLDREARHPTLTKRPRECHAIPLGSGVSAGVQEVQRIRLN